MCRRNITLLIPPCPVKAKCVPVTTAPPKTTKPCILAKCIDTYEPVCGSDGITYANECIALYSDCERQQSGFTIVHKGACEVPCVLALCLDEDKPVCGSEGVTYKNKCHALYTSCDRQESIGFTITEGPCEA